MLLFVKTLEGTLTALEVPSTPSITADTLRAYLPESFRWRPFLVMDEKAAYSDSTPIPVSPGQILTLFFPLPPPRAVLKYVSIDEFLAPPADHFGLTWGDCIHGIDRYADVMDVNHSHAYRAVFDGAVWHPIRNRMPAPFEVLTSTSTSTIPLGYWSHCVEWERFCPSADVRQQVLDSMQCSAGSTIHNAQFELDDRVYHVSWCDTQARVSEAISARVWFVKRIGDVHMLMDADI